MWTSVARPASLAMALRALRDAPPRTRLVAGGTDLVVEQQRGVKPADHLIDLTALDELRYIRIEGDTVALGGLATHNDVLASPELQRLALPLAQACIEVGAPQIRTRATIAGNLVTASPANDTITPLIALDAEVVLAHLDGAESEGVRIVERVVRLSDFYTGFRSTVLRPDEIVSEIRFRGLHANRRGIFLKLGLRRAQAISVINVAIVIGGETRIALGCVAPTIIRAQNAEELLRGRGLDVDLARRAGEIAAEEIAPIDDIRGSAEYRRQTVSALVERALIALMEGREAEGFSSEPVLLETPQIRSFSIPKSDGVVARINGETRELPTAMRTTLLNALRD
ncbi:MAG: xanthine dehydrogenase family protein subunit M, partial [Candidatus Eremiobacteraeota bacterium]|nr:xanthine dehydrogenase family protein subunit M [Candidatus Eremiobacteraeota bacterium]